MTKPESKRTGFPVEEIILIIMVIFSLIGIAVTDHSPQDAFIYWMAMFFVFGVAAMVVGWYNARREQSIHDEGNTVKELFKDQSLHWLGSLLIVGCLFSFVEAGHMTQEATGLMVLLLLALATFLDGIRLGWRFCLAGLFLAVAVVVSNMVENAMAWLFALAAIMIVFTIFLEKRKMV